MHYSLSDQELEKPMQLQDFHLDEGSMGYGHLGIGLVKKSHWSW